MFEHQNFDLKIEGNGTEDYTVQATGPGGERASGPFDRAVLAGLAPDLLAIREQRATPGTLERVGTALFEALLPRQVLRVYDHVRPDPDDDRDPGPRRGLRLRLHLPPELAPLPWELLCDQAAHLCLDPRYPIIRFLDLPDAPTPLAVRAPLRLLHLISSPVDHPQPLDVDKEEELLHQALSSLQAQGLVEILPGRPGTLQTLRRQRRRGCHVLHFSGHGGFDDGEGYLVFEDDDRRQRRVTGAKLANLLRGSNVRLAVLNACETARASDAGAFASVAGALARAGLPAVIAFQHPIPDHSAILFATEFYRALADGLPVDAAVCESRKAIHSELESGDWEPIDWATPVLYLRAPDGRILIVESDPGNDNGPRRGATTRQTNIVNIDLAKDSRIDIGTIHTGAAGTIHTGATHATSPGDASPVAADPQLPDLVRELDQRVCALAPREKRELARAQVTRLERALNDEPLDLNTIARVWRWFQRELLPLSGAVLSIITWAEPLATQDTETRHRYQALVSG